MRSSLPVSDVKVEPAFLCYPTGGPDQLLAIWAEHREAVEFRVVRHLLEACSIWVDQIELEVAAPRILIVRREDDPPVVGREKRREVGATEVRDLLLVRPVGVHDPDLHPVRANQTLLD